MTLVGGGIDLSLLRFGIRGFPGFFSTAEDSFDVWPDNNQQRGNHNHGDDYKPPVAVDVFAGEAEKQQAGQPPQEGHEHEGGDGEPGKAGDKADRVVRKRGQQEDEEEDGEAAFLGQVVELREVIGLDEALDEPPPEQTRQPDGQEGPGGEADDGVDGPPEGTEERPAHYARQLTWYGGDQHLESLQGHKDEGGERAEGIPVFAQEIGDGTDQRVADDVFACGKKDEDGDDG